MKHIFIIGLDEDNLRILARVPATDDCRFHTLICHEELRGVESFPIEELRRRCSKRLTDHQRRHGRNAVHAITTLIDFPATELAAILTRDWNLPGPSLEAVLKCNHKYWSRALQREVVPEHVPRFAAFDPWSCDESHIKRAGLRYPLWIKPMNAFRSYLAFRIRDAADLGLAMVALRRKLPMLFEPLREVMRHADVPAGIVGSDSPPCLAEEVVRGRQCTLEGYVHNGKPTIYGIVDSIRHPHSATFSRYQYPSTLPARVQQRMATIACRLVEHLGLVESAFDVEMFYNRRKDHIWILEINPRLSQSHCELFEKVDGVSHHKVMIDLAMGRQPRMPRAEGAFAWAAKFFVRAFEDALVTAIPDPKQIERVEQLLPGTAVRIHVRPGMRLSELTHQDSYSYELAELYLGGQSPGELLARYRQCMSMLHFELAPAGLAESMEAR